MLLFLIGLEVRPQRLWVMRRAVFGLGTAQVVITGAALAALAHAAGVAWQGAVVLGAGLAMSSTAIVLPMLAERDLLTSRAGRDAFAVLLFQDLAFIPLVALVPLLAGDSVARPRALARRGTCGGRSIAVILIGGRFLLRPLFRAVGGAKTPEVFTTVALLIVAGTALLATVAGLSPSLGAFMAGVLLSESEYRHELQADIEPFEGLLLGFFFISVGMSADLPLARDAAGAARRGDGGTAAGQGGDRLRAGAHRRAGHDRTRCASASPCRRPASSASCCSAPRSPPVRSSAGDAAFATLVTAASMVATPILFAGAEAGCGRG